MCLKSGRNGRGPSGMGEIRARALTGIDLTERAIEFTAERLAYYGLKSELRVADAEKLPFSNNSFDIVYSYGVLHHSPDTAQAIREVYRVLRSGGTARIMIYIAVAGGLYALAALWTSGRETVPKSARDLCATSGESRNEGVFRGGTWAMLSAFSSADIGIQLGPGDLLEGAVGQRHRGAMLSAAKSLWPRWFIRSCMKKHGLGMLITAVK